MKTLALVAFIALAAPAAAQHQRPPAPPDRLPQPAQDLLRAPAAGQVGVLPVQGNIYLLNLGDVNIVAHVGLDGILLVDSGPADWSDRSATSSTRTCIPITPAGMRRLPRPWPRPGAVVAAARSGSSRTRTP
jgi:hypothetical protein